MKYVKYCCFELTDRAGISNVVDHHTVDYMNTPVQGKHCVHVLDYPNVFRLEVRQEKDNNDVSPVLTDNDEHIFLGTFFIGWDNLPTWRYFPDENRFVGVDPHHLEGIKRFYRRHHLIPEDLQYRIRKDTELKHLRKAMKALVELVPEAKKDQSIQEFLSLSDYIESIIARNPKEKLQEINFFKEEGSTPERIQSIHSCGLDVGCPSDLEQTLGESNDPIKVERERKRNEKRIELEKEIIPQLREQK